MLEGTKKILNSQLPDLGVALALLLLASLGDVLSAQAVTLTPRSARVTVDGAELAYPFAGGLNNPQVGNLDFNGDGLADLYIFDKTGYAHLVFLREADSYRYAPEFSAVLPPELLHWVVPVDYDGDGITDLFTAHETFSGIRVYKGYRDSGDTLRFNRLDLDNEFNILLIPSGNGEVQIYVSQIDYPAITDVDCDGDLDVLTFNPAGGYLEFFRNRSVEGGFGRDSLLFQRANNCYGGFYESGLSIAIDLPAGPGDCFDGLQEAPQGTPRHAGSTILAFDANADGVKDLLLGDLSFDELNLLVLAGDCGADAYAAEQITPYPNTNTPLDVAQFPAAFYLDTDFDAVPDLLAAPNLPTNAEDIRVLWQYHNSNTADSAHFEFVTDQFLVGDMIDLGTGARPVPFDYNADGLLDLVIGNYSRFTGGISRESRILLFENTSTADELRFTLVDDDYLAMNPLSNSTFGFHPAFGDLDGDGDLDALVGEETGTLYYVENTAGPGATAEWAAPQSNYMDIDIGQTSVPQIIDLNRDGQLDLIIGERSGNVDYFENIGVPGTPFFDPDPGASPNVEIFGGLDARVPGVTVGYSSPWFVDIDGAWQLFMGIQDGPVERYSNIDGNLDGSFTLLEERLGNLDPGIRSHPALADWDQDGLLEMLIGNHRGGVQFYDTDLPASIGVAVAEPPATEQPVVYPNPFRDRVVLDRLPAGWQTIELLTLDGRVLRTWSGSGEPRLTLSLGELPRGVYFLRLRARQGSQVLRVVKG